MKKLALALALLVPATAIAQQLVRGQMYVCGAKVSKGKIRKERICQQSESAARFTFVGRWADWDGHVVVCRQTHQECVYER